MIGTLEEIVGAPLELEEVKAKRSIVRAYRSERAPVVAARVRSRKMRGS